MSRPAPPPAPDRLDLLEQRVAEVERLITRGAVASGAPSRRAAPAVAAPRPAAAEPVWPRPAGHLAPRPGTVPTERPRRVPSESASGSPSEFEFAFGPSFEPERSASRPEPATESHSESWLRLDEAFVGGRLLAWAGGAALLAALATLLWLGVRDGWLGEELRCVLGAVASAALLTAGLRNARSGRAGEVSWVMAGTGLAGLYATTAVATTTYGLLPDAAGIALLAALGVAAAGLALRWDAPPLAGAGLLGALAAPVLAPVDGLVLPMVIGTMAATGLLLRHRPWTWLAAVATVLGLPQVAYRTGVLLDGIDGSGSVDPSALAVAASGVGVVAAAAAGLLMVAGWEIARPRAHERWSMPLLLVVHAAVAAALGAGYAAADRPWEAAATLAGVAAVFVLGAVRVHRRARSGSVVEVVLLAAAVLVVDLGFALVASGFGQLVGWAVTGLCFAVLARRAARARVPVLIGGLGLHAGLALVETVGAAEVGTGTGLFASAAVLAALCAVSARVVAPRSPGARMVLDASALTVALGWTAIVADPEVLACVAAAEAAALALLDRRAPDVVARLGALVLLGVGATVATLHADGAALEAAWGVAATDDLLRLAGAPLAVALAAMVAVAAWGRPGPRMPTGPAADGPQVDAVFRGLVVGGAGSLGLLAASIAVGWLTVQLGGGDDAIEVARDVLWGSTGLALVAAGLLRDAVLVRSTGLLLLAGVGLKIALLDLAGVDTAGRVVAWAVLGALLLVGAALYRRLRPAVSGD
ncbi:DUF2339 domain-containing protein [Patulibacter americanus]|uniref:DUF2339 domain-containing protein n=1 Tax=Patulibacter americanus TaxID=588672 RepID=UPI0003B5FB00|nr:DUF2339 domain-containing protein [Patulibacter americanus]